MKNLSILTIAIATVASFTTLSTSAQAANYYNCANATGCNLVSTKNPRDSKTDTQYPVVMAHGVLGWTKLFNLVDYFNGIPEELMKGGTEVYTTKTSSINNAEVRGEQLLQQVQTISAITGKEKVNLIGHSLGGIDIRYVAAIAPEYVASVTAISSPEQGSKMADWAYNKIIDGSAQSGYAEGEYNLASKATFAIFKVLGIVMDIGSGIPINELQDQDSLGAVKGLTTDYMSDFNTKYPQAMPSEYCGQPPAQHVVNDIPYYSLSGVGTILNPFDASDYLLKATSLPFGNSDANDGLVSACSSRIGYVIRDDYKMNHLDTVNQLFGLVAWGRADPKALYRNQVIRLKDQGL